MTIVVIVSLSLVEELPTTLMILNLEGNLCQQTEGYRDSILRHCHQLSQLDNELLDVDERRAAGHEIVSDSEGSDEENSEQLTPYNYQQPFDAKVVGEFFFLLLFNMLYELWNPPIFTCLHSRAC